MGFHDIFYTSLSFQPYILGCLVGAFFDLFYFIDIKYELCSDEIQTDQFELFDIVGLSILNLFMSPLRLVGYMGQSLRIS